MPVDDFCAIDFGTSNSAIAIPCQAGDSASGRMRLVTLEPGHQTMPTAVFYHAEDASREFGRAAIAAYVDGAEGRLLRSIKSILGADLIDETTEIGNGHSVKYLDVVIGYLKHLKTVAEGQHQAPLRRVVIGRPVRFVDDDLTRDAMAQDALRRAALAAGFVDVEFEFEPIAAALDYRAAIVVEETVLVADIGGGTSDFSLVRLGAATTSQLNGTADEILASGGVHIAGTDFDQAVNIAAIMPSLGLGTLGPLSQQYRRVPSKVYFDLATWHLINTVYSHQRATELREMRCMYANRECYERLLTVVKKRLGHALAALAESAKIAVAQSGTTTIKLDLVEEGLAVAFDDMQQSVALHSRVKKIVETALATVHLAKIHPDLVNTLYFTGGSTGLTFLTDEIAAKFPNATIATGDRFASVVAGLGIRAQQRFGVAA